MVSQTDGVGVLAYIHDVHLILSPDDSPLEKADETLNRVARKLKEKGILSRLSCSAMRRAPSRARLNEVGKLPAETQIALLRVLQEHEFECGGGSRRIRADVNLSSNSFRERGECTFPFDKPMAANRWVLA
jgi:MoxR-like ATPase